MYSNNLLPEIATFVRFVELQSFDALVFKACNVKRQIAICRHNILYPLGLGLSFPNDAEILRPKVGLWFNQITN